MFKYKVEVFVRYIETDELYALETRDVEAEYNGQAWQKVRDACLSDDSVVKFHIFNVFDVTRMGDYTVLDADAFWESRKE